MAAPPPYPVNPNDKYGQQPPMPYPVQPGYPVAQPGFAQPQPAYPVYPGQMAPTAYPPQGYQAPVPQANQGYVYQPGTQAEPKLEEGLTPGFGASFGSVAIRHAFVRKVYLILMCQLLVTFGFVALFTFHTGLKRFVQQNLWVYLLSYGVFIVTYITLVCCSSVRRKYPTNVIMLSIFTLAMSYMTGTISSTYDTDIVFMTVGITAAICLVISLFATQTKYDFTSSGMYLFIASIVLMIFGLVAIFTYSHIMRTIYSAGIALLFSMYLVYDTQMLIGGRKYELSPEEHVFGAITLYMDVIMIFTALLGLQRN